MSLFELPVSRGARAARLGLVLGLDAMLAGAGIWLLLSYLATRSAIPPAALGRPDAAAEAAAGVAVEVLPARSLGPGAVGLPPPDRAVSPERRPAPARSEPAAPSRAVAGGSEPTAPAPAPGPAAVDAAPVANEAVAGDAGATPDDVEAGRFTDVLAEMVAGHQPQLHRCYERAAKATSTADPLEGTIVLHFTLVPAGRFERVSSASNETGSPQLAACVVALVESWTVPGGPDGPLEFEWPFRFRAQK